MKKGRYTVKTILAAIAILLCLMCVACSQEPQNLVAGYGTLEVSTATSSKTIEPSYEDRRCTGCIVYIRSLTTSYSNALAVENGHCIIDNLEAGEYEVYVEGLNSNGTSILKSETQKVAIRNKETTTAMFRLNRYVEGVGTFSFSVSVPVNDDSVDGVVFTLFDATDEALEYPNTHIVDQPSISTDGKYRMYSIELQLDAGSYNFAASMFQYKEGGAREQVGFTHIESLHVFNSATSESSLVWDKEFFPAIEAPVIDLEEGLQKEGSIARIISTDPRAEIYYTIDGKDPTIESNQYLNPIPIDKCMTLKAIAAIEGLRESSIVEKTYIVKVEDPVFSIKDKSMVDFDDLEITTATKNARIVYTLDGSDPSLDNGKEYTKPITIEKSLIVKAIAFKDGLEPSEIVSAEYYDENSASPDRFFSITDQGAISLNKDLDEELPSTIILPSRIGDKDVVAIAANGFRRHKEIVNISIPSSVTRIEARAFEGCTSIESIDLSEYITSIDKSAFSGWTAKQRINDHSGLIRADFLGDCDAKIYATVKTGTQVVSGYTGMSSLYGIYMTNNITEIADNAFSGCINLYDFELPKYVTKIGELAFNDCKKIKTITLPSILKTVEQDAFMGWTNEQSIIDNSSKALQIRFTDSEAKIYTKIPSKIDDTPVREIPANAGAGRSDIYGLEIPDTVESIGDYAFEGTNIEKIVIPATVKSLGLELFKGWNDSQNVEIIYGGYDASVSDDGLHTPFTGTDAIFKVSIPDDVSEIKSDAFNGMSSLVEISIPDSVKTIGRYAFKGTSLRDVSLGDGVTSIGCGSFIDCSRLETIDLGTKIRSIGERAFANCNKLSAISILSSVESIGTSAFENCGKLGDISFRNGLISIGDKAFRNCSSLKEVRLSDSVLTIGDEVFSNCRQLETIDLGLGITIVPSKTFYGSSNIKSITAPNCMGSMIVTVKVPLNQLIVHDIDISVTPTYASIKDFSTSITRNEQTIDRDYRVFTYEIPTMLGLDYTINVVLDDYEREIVGSKTYQTSIYSNKTTLLDCNFLEKDIDTRPLSNTSISPSGYTIVDGQEIILTNENADFIYYTLDGSTPSEFNGQLYETPIVLHSLKKIRAVGIKEGYNYSNIAYTYYKEIMVVEPSFSVASGSYPSTQYVSLATPTEDATIHYTLDGSYPSKNSPLYDGEPITISETKTLKAIACKDGFKDSSLVEATYEISIPSHEIETPVVRSLSIEKGMVDGVVRYTSKLTPSAENAVYEWYVDGSQAGNESYLEFKDYNALESHLLEVKVKVGNISYSCETVVDATLSYRVNLNSQWVKDFAYVNPDKTLYDGVYKSNSNYNVNSSSATMKILVKGSGGFIIYVRSYAEGYNDYLKVYNLDSTSSIKLTTSGRQNSSREISGYTLVSFDIPDDCKEHVITITYSKNSSGNYGEDRGFVLIPRIQ